MRVIFDARMISYPYTGLGRFSGELLIELLVLAKEKGDKYLVILWNQNVVNNNYLKKIEPYMDGGVCDFLFVDCRPVGISQHIKMKKILTAEYGDIYIHPHFDLPICATIPSICFIHDLFPTKVKGYMVKNAFLKKMYFKLMLRMVAMKAKYIYAVSETTKKDFLQEVGGSISNKVGVCLEGPIVRIGSEHIFKRLQDDNFLLYAGDRRPHKNIKKIIDLYALLKKNGYEGSLLLVGATKNYDFDVDEYVKNIEGVKILGQVEDSELLNLYLQMDALVFLSKYEGFGLPVAEAGLLRKKIIVSDGGALKEISPKWAYRLRLNADIKDEALSVLEYLRSTPDIDENYGSNYRWKSVASSVNQKMETIIGGSYG